MPEKCEGAQKQLKYSAYWASITMVKLDSMFLLSQMAGLSNEILAGIAFTLNVVS